MHSLNFRPLAYIFIYSQYGYIIERRSGKTCSFMLLLSLSEESCAEVLQSSTNIQVLFHSAWILAGIHCLSPSLYVYKCGLLQCSVIIAIHVLHVLSFLHVQQPYTTFLSLKILKYLFKMGHNELQQTTVVFTRQIQQAKSSLVPGDEVSFHRPSTRAHHPTTFPFSSSSAPLTSLQSLSLWKAKPSRPHHLYSQTLQLLRRQLQQDEKHLLCFHSFFFFLLEKLMPARQSVQREVVEGGRGGCEQGAR